jgi:radical SAM superfamily enzyme YgiQ (UPF0313 family)
MIPGTVAALKRAGCAEVWMGAESGSQRILDAMDKGIRVEDIRQARENLRLQGIRACFFLQFGYPGETWEDIQSTIRMVRETAPDDIGVSVSYPLPGTRFYSRVAAEMGAKQNWLDSDDLSMMFRGTYGSEFYAALHDALHLEVDLRNGSASDSDLRRLHNLWLRIEEPKSCANPGPDLDLPLLWFYLSEDPKELAVMKPYAPLGILYLSSHLRKKGIQVEVYDATFGSREELFKMLQDGPPSVVGIYGNLMTRQSVLSIVSVARAAG